MDEFEFKGITLLGLGPGDPDLITRQAWRILETAGEVYLRTGQHPLIAVLPAGLQVHTFDDLYEDQDSLEQVYSQIVEAILDLGRRPQGVIYAVPGHPFVAEAAAPEIARRAGQEGVALRVIEGLSFLEPTISALGIDPLPGMTVVDGLEVAAAHVPSFPTSLPAIIAQIHSQAVASDVKLTLSSLYPDEHTVRLVHAAGTAQEVVEELALHEIDRSECIGLFTALYVPPLGQGTAFEDFLEIIAHLRAPNGCPWDREQTHQTLRPHLLEEAYETLSALDAGDPDAMREEFGDLLLQIVLNAQIAAEYGEFNMAEVIQGIYDKIVHRHPHVFGDVQLDGTRGVLLNWEKLKAQERAERGEVEASLLDGVAGALPALVQAQQFQKRAARVGFDWPEVQGVLAKVSEEFDEVQQAEDGPERDSEIGDLLFAVVNLARWYNVDAESALRAANARFRQRFAYIERAVRQQGQRMEELSLEALDALWDEAKRQANAD